MSRFFPLLISNVTPKNEVEIRYETRSPFRHVLFPTRLDPKEYPLVMKEKKGPGSQTP